jgi:hypothetical protein
MAMGWSNGISQRMPNARSGTATKFAITAVITPTVSLKGSTISRTEYPKPIESMLLAAKTVMARFNSKVSRSIISSPADRVLDESRMKGNRYASFSLHKNSEITLHGSEDR